ncbi:MAG: site-specific DNA-methyltransferase [Candidatus Stahlbacteria bacterium]|nr:site-specific DNA-methyltransferase [Candidatus Stahlbacteria bacterium]
MENTIMIMRSEKMTNTDLNKIYCGDCNKVLKDIPSNSVDLVITSPPYFQQREYGSGNGIGNEKKVDESNEYYFNKDAFMEYRDKYMNGSKKTAGNDIGKKYFELIEKSNLSPENKEQARKELYEVIREVKEGKLESFRMKIRGIHALPYGGQAGGRLTQIETKGFTIIKIYGNSIRKDVIESTVETIKGNVHPAVYPEFLVQELIKLLTKENDTVLDPFLGSGTTAVVAKRLKRNYIGIEIHSEYIEYAKQRLAEVPSYTLDLFI